MEITAVAFIAKVGIRTDRAGGLMLECDDSVKSHVQTIHSGALFTLAEAASGEALRARFPTLADQVVPVIRDAQITYRQPATSQVTAFPTISDEAIRAFERRFARKGRATIEVEVEVKDQDGRVVCSGRFKWVVWEQSATVKANENRGQCGPSLFRKSPELRKCKSP
jgi:acyl-coenzyme A thioesterase PaaI-like protein